MIKIINSNHGRRGRPGTRATAQSTSSARPTGRPGRAYARGPNDARPMRHGGSVGNRVKAHAGGGTNRRRERPQTGRKGTAGGSSRVTSVAAAERVFSQSRNKTDNMQRFPISYRRAATGGGNGGGNRKSGFAPRSKPASRRGRILCGVPPPVLAPRIRSHLAGRGKRIRRG